MLYIIGSSKGSERTWHVGDSVPVVRDVQTIQADGHELAYLQNPLYFKNLPMSSKAVVTWHGDIAKFIYSNL
jgi:hypothetical protein